MTQSQRSKIWSVVSLVLLYYALNTWITMQGGHEIFGANLLVAQRVPSAMIGILFCTVLSTFASLVGFQYARVPAEGWHARIPVVGLSDLDTSSREGQTFQGAMMFLMTLVPLASLAHFWPVFASGKIAVLSSPPRAASSIWDVSGLISLDDPARICADFVPGKVECSGGVTFFPFLEPFILAVFTCCALAAAFLFVVTVFCGSGRKVAMVRNGG